jgi:hypothetical protein
VVAAKLLRGRASSVVVFGEGDAITTSLFVDGPASEVLAAYILAGRAAELAAGFSIDRRDSHHDQRRAQAIARQAAWPNLDALDATAAAALGRAERRADQLAHGNLREILRFARTLRAAGGRLAGSEVRDALLAAFGEAWRDGVPRLNRSPLTGQAVTEVPG